MENKGTAFAKLNVECEMARKPKSPARKKRSRVHFLKVDQNDHVCTFKELLQNTRVPWHDACAKQAVASRHVCGGAGRPLNGFLFAEWSVMG